MALLEVKDLSVFYGRAQALKKISFSVEKGEILTLIGANGAGKTTTLRAISGLNQPQEGQIVFKGESIVKVPAHETVIRGVSHVPEGRGIFLNLSVLENLDLGAWSIKKKQ